MITREQGKRFIAVKFSVREDRDLASAVDEVQEKIAPHDPPPYRVAFGGEFEQMQDAEGRLMLHHPASLALDLHPALPGLPFDPGRGGDPVQRL